jgi:hypothetical protein
MICVPIFPEDPYPTTKMPRNKHRLSAFPCCNLAGFRHMPTKLLILAGIFMAVASSACAMSIPGQNHLYSLPQYPGAPRPVYDAEHPPSAMTYAEEAAQSLGVKNGHMDVFATQPKSSSGYLPSISGGLGADGAMLRLRWHPGE